jgi:carbamoylphosphate synthase large subunit
MDALEDLDRAEDRDKFEQALEALNVPQPLGKTAVSVKQLFFVIDDFHRPAAEHIRRADKYRITYGCGDLI